METCLATCPVCTPIKTCPTCQDVIRDATGAAADVRRRQPVYGPLPRRQRVPGPDEAKAERENNKRSAKERRLEIKKDEKRLRFLFEEEEEEAEEEEERDDGEEGEEEWYT